MAQSDAEVVGIAKQVVALSSQFKESRHLSRQLLENGQAMSINWGTLTQDNPSLLDENGLFVDPALAGKSPAEISNAIGSMDTFGSSYWPTHGGNFELLAPPII